MFFSLQTAAAAIAGVVLAYYVLTKRTSSSTPQARSKWGLEPFFGTYDMDIVKASRIIQEFTVNMMGVPQDVADAGERQVFNRTADGSMYQQYILRKNPMYNSILSFQLGLPASLSIPLGPSFDYIFVMLNATTLQGTYHFTMAQKSVRFSIQFQFKPDATGFFDVVTVTDPQVFAVSGPFYRVISQEDASSSPSS